MSNETKTEVEELPQWTQSPQWKAFQEAEQEFYRVCNDRRSKKLKMSKSQLEDLQNSTHRTAEFAMMAVFLNGPKDMTCTEVAQFLASRQSPPGSFRCTRLVAKLAPPPPKGVVRAFPSRNGRPVPKILPYEIRLVMTPDPKRWEHIVSVVGYQNEVDNGQKLEQGGFLRLLPNPPRGWEKQMDAYMEAEMM